MIHWVLYDISDSNKRKHLVQLLKDYSLIRIQKSVFIGKLTQKGNNALKKELTCLFESDQSQLNDSVFIISICNSCVKKTFSLGETMPSSAELNPDTLIL